MTNPNNVTPPWWQTGLVYQIYPRSFGDSNGDGVGDLQGITQKLDYLQWLGVDAIWLSPIFPSPMADFGYDVANYTDVEPLFGTLADMDTLIAEAKARGIRIILDLVPNHTSEQHPWFLESRASRNNPKRDWYHWRDPKPDGSPPNNWLAIFGGGAWEWDETTGQYYLHNFLKEQPDLNWHNPEVREAIFDAIRFWLRRGIGGFRVDVIEYLGKDPAYTDEDPNPDYDPTRDIPRYALKYGRSVQYESDKYVAMLRAVFDEFPDAPMIGEVSYATPIEHAVTYYAAGMHLPFNFSWIKLTELPDWTPAHLSRAVVQYDALVPPEGWPNHVFANHDKSRTATRFGGQAGARLAAMLLLTLRGTPFLYYGDELGLEDVAIAPEQVRDPFGLRVPGQGRDMCRTPMLWTDGPNAGFAPAEATPWLPLGPQVATANVEAQRNDPRSVLSLYKTLIHARRMTPALNQGRFYPVDLGDPNVIAYIRRFNDQARLVVLNFNAEARTLAMPGQHSGRVLLSTHLDREEEVDLSALQLRASEGVLIELPTGTQTFPVVELGV